MHILLSRTKSKPKNNITRWSYFEMPSLVHAAHSNGDWSMSGIHGNDLITFSLIKPNWELMSMPVNNPINKDHAIMSW